MFQHPKLQPNIYKIELSKTSFWGSFQHFNDDKDFRENWIVSENRITGGSSLRFPIHWNLSRAYVNPGFSDDICLAVKENNGEAMIGHILDYPIKLNGSSKLVIQYEIKLQNELQCGGAFIKLFPDTTTRDFLRNYNPEDNGETEMQLLFGPDKCIPSYDGVRFGLVRKNLISEKSELKQLVGNPQSKLNSEFRTHLYTLILDSSNQEYEIRIDGVVTIAGNLHDEGRFVPGFNTTKTIPDTTEEKPEEWDDRETIPDPSIKKPDDWDENEPYRIPDPHEFKPLLWDSTIPELICKPGRQQPSWWVAENDGEWVAPLIKNPSCYSDYGCGKWKPKMIINKKYKGKWKAPEIGNENYMGIWEPKEISNPEFFEDITPGVFENDIGAIVFEFLSGSKDMLIDNIYLGNFVREAELLGNVTYLPKRDLELKEIELRNNKMLKLKEPKRPEYLNDEIKSDNLFDLVFDYIFQKYDDLPSSIEDNLFATFASVTVIYIFIKIKKLFSPEHSKLVTEEKLKDKK